MGLVYAEIELINGGDLEMARRHIIGQEEVKRMKVNALVGTGSYMLCINENIQEQLQLPVVEKRKAQLASQDDNSSSTGSQVKPSVKIVKSKHKSKN